MPGKDIDADRLAEICLELEAQGAHNINLVTASHHVPHVISGIRQARAAGLSIPIVFNTSGYELPSTIDLLAGVVNVWLTDFKYADPDLAHRYSNCHDYPSYAVAALRQMLLHVERAGGRLIGSDGTMRRGIIIRHLVLPNAVENACAVLDMVHERCGTAVDVSIMNQYTPNQAARRYGNPLNRPVSQEEYDTVLVYANDLGFEEIWWQEGGTISDSFVPSWDGKGV